MSYQRESLQTIIDRMVANANSRISGADANLYFSVINGIMYSAAAAVHGLYGHQEWISRQILPDTADDDMLERHANVYSLNSKPPTAASGNVTFAGTDGTVVTIGTVVQRSDAVAYQTTEAGVIVAGVITLAAEAVTTGLDTNAAEGMSLTLVTSLDGVNGTATVAAGGMTGGANIETPALLLDRLINHLALPPHGGAAHDYAIWAREVAGVTRAWSYPLEGGDGTVTIRFMMDDTYASGIPLEADVAAVSNYIAGKEPFAIVTIAAPMPVTLDFTISGITDLAVRAAVEVELADMIDRDAKPGVTIYLSRIREAISIAPGEINHVLTAPAEDVTHTLNRIPIMGSVTWT